MQDDCGYGCMLEVEAWRAYHKVEYYEYPAKFYGKWVFRRIAGQLLTDQHVAVYRPIPKSMVVLCTTTLLLNI